MGVSIDDKGKELREKLRKKIVSWHDKIKPEYVFLTERSAVPYGYLFKEAWKKAYGKEGMPKFYRINPDAIQQAENDKSPGAKERAGKRWLDYIRKRVKNKDASVVVFDEDTSGVFAGQAWTTTGALDGLRLLKRYTWIPQDEEDRKFERNSKSVDEENEYYYQKYGLHNVINDSITGGEHIQVTEKERFDPKVPLKTISFTGRTIKDPAKKKEAQETIKYMKSTGKEIGDEIRVDEEQKKHKHDLEGKIGAFIGISGILLSLFFLSSNFTGFAISNLTQSTSNIIGAVLFLIGIVGVIFYFIKKH